MSPSFAGRLYNLRHWPLGAKRRRTNALKDWLSRNAKQGIKRGNSRSDINVHALKAALNKEQWTIQKTNYVPARVQNNNSANKQSNGYNKSPSPVQSNVVKDKSPSPIRSNAVNDWRKESSKKGWIISASEQSNRTMNFASPGRANAADACHDANGATDLSCIIRNIDALKAASANMTYENRLARSKNLAVRLGVLRHDVENLKNIRKVSHKVAKIHHPDKIIGGRKGEAGNNNRRKAELAADIFWKFYGLI